MIFLQDSFGETVCMDGFVVFIEARILLQRYSLVAD